MFVQTVDVKVAFGISLKAWRKRLGLSQEELAERADLHRTYVSDVERGSRNLSLESITRIAQALNISAADFFPADAGASNAKDPSFNTNGAAREWVNILLVEDNADDVQLTLRAFKHARIANRITVAGDGREALDFLFCQGKYSRGSATEHPHLVLLDLSLPKVNGLEVLRRMKADERTATIPVVILMASQMMDGFAECQRLGAQTYVLKPLSFEKLSQITPRLNLDWALFKPPGSKPPA